jgi:O-antigen/teichoic acid export membrane protein
LTSGLQNAKPLLGLELSPERLRLWGIRTALSILDQGLTSGAGFVLNLLLARWLTSEQYGAFAVAFTAVLFLFGFHTALLLEPISVLGPASYSTRICEYFASHLKLHAVVAMVLCGVLFLAAAIVGGVNGQRELAWAFGGAAIALPFLLLLWLVRRMCYVVHRPSMAVWGSTSYLAFISIGLLYLHANRRLNPFSAFLLIGAASIPAVVLLLHQLGVVKAGLGTRLELRRIALENWNYGRWLVAGTVLYSVTSQVQTYLAAALLGLAAAGTLRALQIPSLVMTQIVTALGLLVLPALARDFGTGRFDRLRKKGLLVGASVTALALAYAASLALFSGSVEQILFEGRFAAYRYLIPLLAVIPVFTACASGFSMVLRAAQKSHFDLIANCISAPVSLISALVFIRFWGVGGAGLSMVVGFATYAFVLFCCYKAWTKSISSAVRLDLSSTSLPEVQGPAWQDL